MPRSIPAKTPIRNGAPLPTPVRAPKLSHLVADQLRGRIASGQLGPGDTLPSEADLLGQFGVSRPTLREALRVLESEALIKLGRGARTGATVLAPSIETATKHSGLYLATRGTTVAEINEVRLLLEPQLASLLAQSSRKDAIKQLRRCYEAQQAGLAAEDYLAVISAIIEFHDVMVLASENRALGLVAGILHDLALQLYPKMLTLDNERDRQIVRRRTGESSVAHGRLIDLISEGKAKEAETFWRRYMEDTAKWLARTGVGKIRISV